MENLLRNDKTPIPLQPADVKLGCRVGSVPLLFLCKRLRDGMELDTIPHCGNSFSPDFFALEKK
jgi:hypothetical protein